MKKVILLIVIAILFAFKSNASHIKFYMDSTSQNSQYDFCTDSLIVYKMSAATSGIRWDITNYGQKLNVDSIIITVNNNGSLYFKSTQTIGRTIYIYLWYYPHDPGFPKDTTFCNNAFSFKLDAKNQDQLNNYLWQDSIHLRTHTINTFGLFWVQISNICGTIYDSMTVTKKNYNPKPNLGSDQTTCLGGSVNLDPGHTGLFKTFLWSTGENTSTINADSTGTYAVQTTDTSNCVESDTVNLHFVMSPLLSQKPNLGTDKTTCWKDTITLDPGYTGLFNTFTWSTGESTPTIDADTTGTYTVLTRDTFGCYEGDTIHLTFLTPLNEQICYTTFDSITQKNLINWAVDINFKSAASVKVYTRDTLNNVTLLAQAAYGSGKFIDNSSDPQNQSYQYFITIVDTCGNESEKSTPHKTIRLNKSVFGNEIDFTWSKYEGLSVPYYILNGIKRNGVNKYIATVASTFDGYNYVNPDTSIQKYYVSFPTNSCLTRASVVVRSNYSIVKQDSTTSINKSKTNNFKVYPNPINDKLIVSNFEGKVIITNIFGQSILEKQSNGELIINTNDWQSGTYLVLLKTDDGLSVKKILKQ